MHPAGKVGARRQPATPLAKPEQQSQGSQAAQQMRHHNHRLQEQRDRPHAQQSLEYHECEQEVGKTRGLFRIAPVGPGQSGHDQAEQAEARGQVAVDHFPPRLAHVQRPFRECLGRLPRALRHEELPVAPRPVGATQSRVRQTHPGADDDDQQSQHRTDAGQPHETRLQVSFPGCYRYRPPVGSWIRRVGGCRLGRPRRTVKMWRRIIAGSRSENRCRRNHDFGAGGLLHRPVCPRDTRRPVSRPCPPPKPGRKSVRH